MDNQESELPCCNPSAPEYLIADLEKMKGDAIGDTLYSERWVLKTLMKIIEYSDDSWNEELESELCALWDMTLEKDVVNFLMDQNIFLIVTDALQVSQNNRFIEILVGIIGNMCCQENVRTELLKCENTITFLLKLFERPEPHILIQLVRLLHSIAWDLVKESGFSAVWLESELSNSRLSKHIFFILNSSTNEELLSSVLEFLNTLCALEISDKDFSQYFCSPEMITGMIECWKELYSGWALDENFPSKSLCKAASHWTTVLSSFTGYETGRTILCHYGVPLGEICKRIIQRPDDCIDDILISSLSVLDTIINVYFDSDILKRVLYLLNMLLNMQSYDETDKFNRDSDALEGLLLNCIESYCLSASTKVVQTVLHEILSTCPENHVLLFWKSVNDKQADDPGERAI
ncbi:unnamed protein product [Nezara viridula]|uniref:Protein SAAL1 n=1 Tax=Nezara viridula TaxID=85310 RepID=A0A9P0MRG7_NEZVI|nr:unnamed protein product [Nezara viridula]